VDASGKFPCSFATLNTHRSSSDAFDEALSPLDYEIDWLEVCSCLAPPRPRGDSLWDELFGPDHNDPIAV